MSLINFHTEKYSQGIGGILFKILIYIFILLLPLSAIFGQTQFTQRFQNFEGTIVVYDQNTDSSMIFNQDRAKIRFSPFSTFKIPNSIIALETGIVTDVDQFIKWDGQKYPAQDWWPAAWNGEHNLRSGIKYSVVPLYRHIASQIGEERMKHYVDEFDYGNRDISSGIDNFWLNGSLAISALEQIDFLRKFYPGRLNVSPKTVSAVKSILIQEKTGTYTFSAKTGGGYLDKEQTRALGWLVGYVEKDENVYYFALNIEGRSFDEIREPRIVITKNILKDLGIIQ